MNTDNCIWLEYGNNTINETYVFQYKKDDVYNLYQVLYIC